MPNRREFLGLIGASTWTSLPLPGIAHDADGAPARASMTGKNGAKAFGSGYFGEWITDDFGLPAYRYTCDQMSDPKARTRVHKEWRAETDHAHQVGNDRLTAAVSNYGYLQVRQDEGSPKFLNDYSPEHGRYGGGIGLLTDGKVTLSTYYSGDATSFDRIFGTGYLRKRVAKHGYEVDQVVFAPFGDDPVLISQVKITNSSGALAKLRWIEYWGCHHYPLSYRSFLQGALRGSATRAAELRRELADRFSHRFRTLPGGTGLVETKTFHRRTLEDHATWLALQLFLRMKPNTFMGGPIPDLAPGAAFDDLHPPPTFLASLDAPADGYATNARTVFRAGGFEHPPGVIAPLDADLTTTGPESAFLMERAIVLRPGESRTVYFLYGYLPDGFAIDALISKYAAQTPTLWATSSAAWRSDGPRLRVKSQPWVERETTWHHYYLRSGLTYDSFFGEHILSQGSIYQYVLGFQGAARDALQHALPFIFSAPHVVREVLRYTLKEIQSDGSIPYGIVGSGVPMPVIFRPSDLELWLLWLASEYVLATRDQNFLEERLPPHPNHRARPGDPTIRELLAGRYRHVVDSIGVGKHGLMRLSNGDWNDAIVGDVTPETRTEIQQEGESMLNAAMASYVLDHYARMLGFTGETRLAADVRARAEAQRQAVRAQWNGRWFRRAWLGPGGGWVGEKQMWLEPQPWALIGGAATSEHRTLLTEALNQLVRRPSPIGAMLHSAPVPNMGTAGVLTNGGVWPSINGTLVWALAGIDQAQAWDEWRKNSLAAHAEAYPYVWYGIWSGPDSYNSILARNPGETMFTGQDSEDAPVADLGLSWTDFPVMNMHIHAWPLYSAAKLLGLEFHETGLRFTRPLPLDEYEFTSQLLGFRKTKAGYSGWYAPAANGHWSVEIALSRAEGARFKRLEINGSHQALVTTGETLRFAGASENGKPLRWVIS